MALSTNNAKKLSIHLKKKESDSSICSHTQPIDENDVPRASSSHSRTNAVTPAGSVVPICYKKFKGRSNRSAYQTSRLRKKFLETALSYMNIPYARRYHPTPTLGAGEGDKWGVEDGSPDPHYDAPLYLDCCGLVRKVLRDLKDDFGFKIGGGNQGYQIDTLPIVLREEDMQPGDLVFTEAPMYDLKRFKNHTHNITHVEIWMGDGKKTLGARWGKRWVEVHDSYEFTSKNYGPNKYHFRSINTWLRGDCKSFCTIHDHAPNFFPVRHTKKSLEAATAARSSRHLRASSYCDGVYTDVTEPPEARPATSVGGSSHKQRHIGKLHDLGRARIASAV